MRKKYLRNLNAQRGQAMVESVIVISVLMVAIVGLVAVVSLQRRIYLENVATSSLNLTFSTFTNDEVQASEWAAKNSDAAKISKHVVENVVNTPADRFKSKKQIGHKIEVSSRTLPKYTCAEGISVMQTGGRSDETQFAVNGCSKERGWLAPVKNMFEAIEPVPTYFMNAPQVAPEPLKPLTILDEPEYNLASESLTTKSLFVGKSEFQFSRRMYEPFWSYRLATSEFKDRYAQYGEPETEKNLNRDCFFNPYLRITECKKKPSFGAVYVILGRISAAAFSAKMLVCALEMAGELSWLSIFTDIYGAAAWATGNESYVCYQTERAIKGIDKAARGFIKGSFTYFDLSEEPLFMALEAIPTI